MRWEALFSDLAGQWDAAQRADDDARIADLTELEMGRVHLADRLRGRRDETMTVRLLDAHEVTGRVLDAAPDWVLLGVGERRCLVPRAGIAAAWPLSVAAPEAGVVERRLGIAHVLRAIAREGATVQVRTVAGVYRGRLVRVGADHVDVVVESPRRRAPVTVVLATMLSVEST